MRIKSATYERDNGNFECRKVESGTGNKLHSVSVQLVVLLPPGQPSLAPTGQTVTEGKPLNLTCSSVGGSPPPAITWYRDTEVMEALYIPGSSRTQASSAVLTLVPRKEDDDASYRCTVWNRALGQRQKLETRASLTVNCESSLFAH